MGSNAGQRKRSHVDASVKSNQASCSGPRKSPRLTEHAQRCQLIQPENGKVAAKEKVNFCLGLRRSPRLIQQAKHQELESSEDKRKRQENERSVYQRIRHSFVSEDDRALMLEQRRIRYKEKKSALSEEETERNLERRRNSYRKRRQQSLGEASTSTSKLTEELRGTSPPGSATFAEAPGFSTNIEWMNPDQVLTEVPLKKYATNTVPGHHNINMKIKKGMQGGQFVTVWEGDSERDKNRPLEMDKLLEHHVNDRERRVRNDQEAGPSKEVPRQSPQYVEQVQLRDVEVLEESRKKKGKSVVTYQRRRRANVSYIPDINTVGAVVIGSARETNNHDSTDDSSSDDGQGNAKAASKNAVREPRPSTTGASTSTAFTSQEDIFRRAIRLPLRRSPRFSQHPQHGEPALAQNLIEPLVAKM
ncbi:hypothetical protein C5167_004116 [Papaver somniferum]|nr:hypothetical protein C5167_004116 [Papaver somniferum]